MNTNALLGGLMLAATTTGLLLQNPDLSGPTPGLQPIPAPQAGGLQPLHASSQAPADTALPADWRTALSAPDFAERTQAFHQALELVPRDAAFRDSLEAWAADKRDPELAWTAHLLLDLAENQSASRSAAPFDLFGSPFGGSSGGPFGGSLFETFFGQTPFTPPQTPGANGSQFQSRSHWIEADSDGVRMHVETNGPNGKQVETYSADTLEQLKAEHPELFQGMSGRISFQNGPFGGALFGGGQTQLPSLPANGALRTDVLGVMVAATPDGLQGQADGLLIESVLPNTIASRVGLQAGDTIVRINERFVQSREDIAAELAARGAQEVIELEWIDAAGERVVQSWNP